MTEVWLRPNRRPFWALLVALGGLMVAAAAAGWQLWHAGSAWPPMFTMICAVFAIVMTAIALWRISRPVLAFQSGELLLRLHTGRPIRMPIAIIEGFLLGKQETKIGRRQLEVSTLVIRLAEKATEWATVQVHPNLGRWCGGYINIFGTWCEPLSVELVTKLNARLAEVTKQHAASQVAS